MRTQAAARRSCRTLTVAALGGLLLLPSSVGAQIQNRTQRKCVTEMARHLERVTRAQLGDIVSCVRQGGRGRADKLGPGGTIESCLTADLSFAVAKQTRRAAEKAEKRCVSPLPDFGAADPNDVIGAALGEPIALIHDLFGTDLDARVIVRDPSDLASPRSLAVRCQAEMAGWTQGCLMRTLKEFDRCKKLGLRGRKPEQLYAGADSPFDDATDIERCMGFDRLSRIARECDARMLERVADRCEAIIFDPNAPDPNAPDPNAPDPNAPVDPNGPGIPPGVDPIPPFTLGTTFQGGCYTSVSAEEMASCLNRLIQCRFCMLANRADRLSRDCDLVDDGLVNSSCPPTLTHCGDGTVQILRGEECEDGNDQNEDGCSADCQMEYCGDGILQAGLGEECDDGNLRSGDCCTPFCEIEPIGSVCRPALGLCDLEEVCDGESGLCPANVVQPDGTVCDDAEICTIGDRCVGGQCVGSGSCGDGNLQSTLCGEVCDDGNLTQCDGCSNECTLEDGQSAETAAAACAAILADGFSVGNGRYWIDPDCGSKDNAILCQCDMDQGGVCVFCVNGAICPQPSPPQP
ncbi:MAG: DUF4215 domain-containing protein [Myxococcota bacterium]